MKSKPLVYIADLTYNTTVLSNDTFPIGIGYVAAYAQKNLPDSFSFELFKDADALFDMICNCMYQIWQGEEVHDCMDYNQKDKMTFLESLNHTQFEKIQHFFNTMPTLKHDVEVFNPKTKKKSTLTIEGMNSFF